LSRIEGHRDPQDGHKLLGHNLFDMPRVEVVLSGCVLQEISWWQIGLQVLEVLKNVDNGEEGVAALPHQPLLTAGRGQILTFPASNHKPLMAIPSPIAHEVSSCDGVDILRQTCEDVVHMVDAE